jgi:NAD(P)-dependent dehydrogenase (short-subunit alcohol dehydrogenase family)
MSGESFRAVVIGATGALGAAFVRHFEQDPECDEVAAVSRQGALSLDLTQPASIEACARALAARGPFRYIVDATGALTIAGRGPEKSLSALDAAALANAFQINATGPALVLRSFAPLLAPGHAVYAKLSARVGSIGDNREGGWYGYRASKAAMNMMLQCAAIELQRRQPGWRFVALQPGTVRSALSAPFTAGYPDLLEPDAAVAGMMAALHAAPAVAGAQFLDHRGASIPW